MRRPFRYIAAGLAVIAWLVAPLAAAAQRRPRNVRVIRPLPVRPFGVNPYGVNPRRQSRVPQGWNRGRNGAGPRARMGMNAGRQTRAGGRRTAPILLGKGTIDLSTEIQALRARHTALS